MEGTVCVNHRRTKQTANTEDSHYPDLFFIQIEHMDAVLASAEAALRTVKEDIAQRKDNFQLEMKSRHDRAETREEILRVFLNWISSLEAKRYEEREASDLRIKEAIEERGRDRKMLTLAVRQLREVRRVEILLTAQRATMTQGTFITIFMVNNCNDLFIYLLLIRNPVKRFFYSEVDQMRYTDTRLNGTSHEIK